MSEIIKNKYLDLGGLTQYHEKIKAFIKSEDSILANAIADLDAKIGDLNVEGSEDKNLAEIVDGIYASIADIVDEQIALEAKDSELAIEIQKIADDLEFITGSGSENEATLGEIKATLVDLQGELDSVKESLQAAIEKLNGEGEGSVKKIAADAAADAAATAEQNANDYADSLVKDAEGNSLFDAAGSADQALADAKDYADGLLVDEEGKSKFDAAGSADQALADAKDYADGLLVDEEGKSKFDAAGSAAAAQAAAIADAEGKYQVKGDYEAAGTAAGLNAAMDERVKALEEIDHNKIAADAAAEAVAAVVADADSDFDTLKEIADWITSDKDGGAAALQTTVSGHTDSINTINGELDALEETVRKDIGDLTEHLGNYANKIVEVEGRLDTLEAFEAITVGEIEGLFESKTEE